jgi:hypothetical protein
VKPPLSKIQSLGANGEAENSTFSGYTIRTHRMEPTFPYQPPQPPEFTYLPPGMTTEPPVVKIFGVLHLVLAGYGLLFSAWGLFIAIAGNPMLKFFPASGPMAKSMDAQLAMQAKIMPATLTASILSIVIAVPMIIAGIQLLKGRKSGLVWSNRYAYTSLAAKCVNLILAVVIVIPAMREMTQGLLRGTRAPGLPENLMSVVMASSVILGVVMGCIYPILSLVLMNRPRVKEWVAGLGK